MMKKIYFNLICFAFFFIPKINAQNNIVMNADFETFTSVVCGWTGSGVDFANGATNWTSPTQATPDNFSSLITNTCSNYVPHANYASPNGWQAPHSGNEFAGFYTYVASSTWREYVQAEFTQPMVPGTVYRVSFYVSLGDNSQYATNNIGANFYTTQQAMGISGEIGGTPAINFTNVISDTTNWVLLSDTIIATAAYQYMIIGNFYNDAGTSIVSNYPAGAWDRTYYYIDDVSIIPISVTAQNFCFGDTTIFDNAQLNGWVASSWDFGDTASGPNNTAYTLLANHLFTAPGTYTVTTINYYITGLNDTIQTQITIASTPVINLGNDSTICIGSSITLQAGAGYTSYLWSSGDTSDAITISTAGTYYVEVDNNGCNGSDTIVISYTNCSPIIALSSSDTSFCEKQCVDFFDMSTNNPTSWQWFFPGASPDTSSLQNPTGICYNSYGSFDVKLIACNSFTCDSIILSNFINEYQNPTDSIWGSNDTLWSLQFPSYQWFNTLSGAIAGATNQYFEPTQLGSYYCVVGDSIGCVGTSNTIALTGLTPGPSPGGEGSIVIAPNPNEGNFEIIFESNYNLLHQNDLKILNAVGQVVFTSELETKNNKFNLNLLDGIYFLQIQNGENLFTKKLIIQK